MATLYRIHNLRYLRTDSTPFEFSVNQFTIPQGGVVAIIGSSGSGKTTFINLLSGLEQPTAAAEGIEITLGGQVHRFGHAGHDGFPVRHVGRVFQQGHLLPSATVAVNIAVAAHAAGVAYNRATLQQALVTAGLNADYLDRRAWQLSGGEAQRVSIARAMVTNPTVIFADEPTSSADPDLAEQLMLLLQQWVQQGDGARTLLWVTHHYELTAEFADQIIVLKQLAASAGEKKAGIIGNETVPRTNPRDPQILHDWVRPDLPITPTAVPEASADNAQPEQYLALRLARGEVYSRRAGNRFFAQLQGLTSIGVDAPATSLYARWQAFQPRNLLIRSFLASLLLLVALGGFSAQWYYFDQHFSNPAFCNLAVSGTPQSDYALTPTFLLALGQRPWQTSLSFSASTLTAMPEDRKKLNALLDKVPSGAGCASSASVWPRYTQRLAIGLPDEYGLCEHYQRSPRGLIPAETMALHRQEPVLDALKLTTGHTVAQAFQQVQPSTLAVVVSQIFVEDGLRISVDDAAALPTLCVKMGHQIEPVEFGGVSRHLPTDRRYFYDAVLPLAGLESLQGTIPSYTYASIYFGATELAALQHFLTTTSTDSKEAGLNYDADVLEKFSDSVTLSYLLAGVTTAIVVLVFVANLLNLAATYGNVIEQNARPIAMQLSLGMPERVIRDFLLQHMMVIWRLSSLALWVLGFVVVGGLSVAGFLNVSDLELAIKLLVFAPLVSFLISGLAIWFSVARWTKSVRENLAETLQAGN